MLALPQFRDAAEPYGCGSGRRGGRVTAHRAGNRLAVGRKFYQERTMLATAVGDAGDCERSRKGGRDQIAALSSPLCLLGRRVVYASEASP